MASERRSIPPRRHASLSSGTAGPPSGSLVSSTDFSLPELAVPVARAAHAFTARLRRLAPHEAAALLPYTTGASAAVSIALVLIKVWRLPSFPYAATVVTVAVSAWFVALLLGVLFGRRPINLPSRVDAGGVT